MSGRVDVAALRASWAAVLEPATFPGETNAGKTWGPYPEAVDDWARENMPGILDALGAAEAKLSAVRERCDDDSHGPSLAHDVLAILDGEA